MTDAEWEGPERSERPLCISPLVQATRTVAVTYYNANLTIRPAS